MPEIFWASKNFTVCSFGIKFIGINYYLCLKMSNQKKNTIKVQDSRTKKFVTGVDNIYRLLADNRDTHYKVGVDAKGNTTYSPVMSGTLNAVTASVVTAEVARRYKTDAKVSAASGSGGLTSDNFMQAIAETIEAINLSTGNTAWFAEVLKELEEQDQAFLTSKLLIDLAKVRLGKDAKPTAEDKSETISMYLKGIRSLAEDLAKVKKNVTQTDIKNVMSDLSRTYLVQSASGDFRISIEDEKIQVHRSSKVESVETFDVNGQPMNIHACVINFIDTTKVAARVSRKHIKKQTPLLYTRCDANGQVSPQHERLVYSESKDLEVRKKKNSEREPGASKAPKVQTGVTATREARDKGDVEKDARDAERLRKAALTLIMKRNPNFATDLIAKGVNLNSTTEIANAFNLLPGHMRNNLVYANVVASDLDGLEVLAQ